MAKDVQPICLKYDIFIRMSTNKWFLNILSNQALTDSLAARTARQCLVRHKNQEPQTWVSTNYSEW